MTLSDLLAAHPKVVGAIEKWNGNIQLTKYDDKDAADRIHLFAAINKIGTPYLDSIATLLGLIEERIATETPLTDAEIEGLRWRHWKGGSHCVMHGETIIRADDTKAAAVYLIEQHNSAINALYAEIRRLRAAKGGTDA